MDIKVIKSVLSNIISLFYKNVTDYCKILMGYFFTPTRQKMTLLSICGNKHLNLFLKHKKMFILKLT
jgi:hypothetical protein